MLLLLLLLVVLVAVCSVVDLQQANKRRFCRVADVCVLVDQQLEVDVGDHIDSFRCTSCMW